MTKLALLGVMALVASVAQAQFLTPFTQADQVSAGWYHTCGVDTGKRLTCWGANGDGQLGDGTTIDRPHPVVPVGMEADVLSVAAGLFHTCALKTSGEVWCWGYNASGQLGDGGPSRPLPAKVDNLPPVQAITSGSDHLCAITQAGALYCWGENGRGALGDNTQVSRPVPLVVPGMETGVQQVEAGTSHTCAIVGSQLSCWGQNTEGRIGDNTTTMRLAPTPVTALGTGVTAVAAGDRHTCAIDEGQAYCWGRNLYGQVGDGSNTDRRLPQLVVGLGPVQAIEAGGFSSCAINTSSALYCWGDNSNGVLGDGTTTSTNSAVPVAGLGNGVTRISLGDAHSVAVQATQLDTWGYNGAGELGDPSVTSIRTVPAAALFNITEWRVSELVPAADGDAIAPVSSASGRYVAFQSAATDLGADDTEPNFDIYRVDTECDAVTQLDGAGLPCERLTRASVDDMGASITGRAEEPSISADGQYIVFVAENAGVGKVYGESAKRSKARKQAGGWGTYMRSLIGSGRTFQMGAAPGPGSTPQIAPGAGFAVLTQPNPAKPEQTEVYRVPLPTIEMPTPTPVCISCKAFDERGQITGTDADGSSTTPVISADGQWVAWQTSAKNLLPTQTPCIDPAQQPTMIMLRNLVSGATQRMGAPLSAQDCANSGSRAPKIDYSGSKIVFESNQPLTPGASGSNVYLFDLLRNATQRISVPPAGGNPNPNGSSTQPTISGDGQTIAFVSTATDLDPNEYDSNGVEDLVIYSIKDQFAKRLARTERGGEANRGSRRPGLNYMGDRLVFDSAAGNLTGTSVLDRSNIYERRSPINLDRVFTAGFD